jgi:hypothetical protein
MAVRATAHLGCILHTVVSDIGMLPLVTKSVGPWVVDFKLHYT